VRTVLPQCHAAPLRAICQEALDKPLADKSCGTGHQYHGFIILRSGLGPQCSTPMGLENLHCGNVRTLL
ncbi:MAG: hypothetical protein LH632_14200, partial [Rhodoferax sp.]|nr:hypothetical protein [Rhodoferax sp.]